jgi:hypothetical protein
LIGFQRYGPLFLFSHSKINAHNVTPLGVRGKLKKNAQEMLVFRVFSKKDNELIIKRLLWAAFILPLESYPFRMSVFTAFLTTRQLLQYLIVKRVHHLF